MITIYKGGIMGNKDKRKEKKKKKQPKEPKNPKPNTDPK